MKALLAKLVWMILIPLFPMVVVSGVVLAEDSRSSKEAKCVDRYSIILDKVRPLNKQQLGLFFSLTDRCGRQKKLTPDNIEIIRVEDQPVPVWQLVWQERESFQKGIQEITGLNAFLTRTNQADSLLLIQTLLDYRTANRVEITTDTNLIKTSTGRRDNKNLAIIKSLARTPLTRKDSQPSVELEIRATPSEKLMTALERGGGGPPLPKGFSRNASRIRLSDANTTESRYYLTYLKRYLKQTAKSGGRHSSPDTASVAFSEIKTALFANAEIIDQTSHPRKVWRYRPESLRISSKTTIDPDGHLNNPSEIVGFFNLFETAVGHNILALETASFLHQPVVKINATIQTPDQQKHRINLRLSTTKNRQHAYRCDEKDGETVCFAHISLARPDLDQISSWQGKQTTSTLMGLDKELNGLFESENYLGCVQLIENMIKIDQIPDSMSIAMAGEWVYKNAISYSKLGKTKNAVQWYRKLTREYPFSRHYVDAWYRLTDIHSRMYFRD